MHQTSFELPFKRFSLEAQLPAGVWENESALKRKSPQTGIQAMEYTLREKKFRNRKKTYLGY